MTEKRTTAFRLQKRKLKRCDYPGCEKGLIKGIFHQSECNHCNGLGAVDRETGEALTDREVIRHLQARLIEQKNKEKVLLQMVSEANSRIPESERVYPPNSIKD